MSAVIVPDAFDALCRMFHQDAFVIHRTMDGVVAFAVGSLSAAERQEVRRFLDKVLDGKHTPSEMKGLLRRSLTDWSVRNASDVPAFLRSVRDALK